MIVSQPASPTPVRSTLWLTLSWASCALGAGTKETIVTAPLLLLLYDLVFVAGSFTAALKRRGLWYAALVATWIPLILLSLSAEDRGGTASLARGIASQEHWATQVYALAHYFRLALWPYPLLFDYETFKISRFSEVIPQIAALSFILGSIALGIRSKRLWAFFALSALLVLAPSTAAYIPLQTIAEHRMYLPLAFCLSILVLSADWIVSKLPSAAIRPWLLLLWAGPVIALVRATNRRNTDYRSELSIWKDTVAKHPTGSSRACYNYGVFLSKSGNPDAAIVEFKEALRLEPNRIEAHDNLANALFRTGHITDALAEYKIAVTQAPTLTEARYNYGLALYSLGQLPAAEIQLALALKLHDSDAEAHTNYGNVLLALGRALEAQREYRRALFLDPSLAEAHNNLGFVLERSGQISLAREQYQAALQSRPDYATAQANLARVKSDATP